MNKLFRIIIKLKTSSFYFNLLKLKQDYRKVACSKNTKIVLEGFPRSANTFAYNIFEKSFLKSNLNPEDIAHHLHHFEQLKLGIKRRIPCIALIREPLNAVSSLIIMQHANQDGKKLRNTIAKYLYQYILFYKHVLINKNNILIIEFEEMINKYDQVIEKVNQKFSKDFSIIFRSDNQSKEILDKIKIETKEKFNNNEMKMSIPSNRKKDLKKTLVPLILNSKEFYKANQLYMELIELSAR